MTKEPSPDKDNQDKTAHNMHSDHESTLSDMKKSSKKIILT